MNQMMRQRPINNTDMPYMNYQPPNKPGHHSQTQTNNQNRTPLHSPEADHPSIEAVKHNKPDLQGPEYCREVHKESDLGFNMSGECPSDCNDQGNECPSDCNDQGNECPSDCNDQGNECPSNCDDLDNECPNNLDEHVNNLSEQEQAYETISDNHDPEVLPEIVPESDDPQVTEPAFSMDNYSARDVDRWARTLSAAQFEQLRILGPASRIESFRQYTISNLNQPTQTPTQQSSLEHPVSMSNGYQDNSNYHHHQPDAISSNNFDQHPLAPPDDDQLRSTFYNHSDDYTSHQEACDSGGFDDGGFDDGGFDNGGFDNGGFDDGGFDDGGFDDGYGSPYY
ncbi:uncharacterized protein PGTG_14031 [Puccinia graminis f. sp. tritici CRL 75-36-700-3]|uniref:Uncharacterized protein n=1 Tax=Puccinia graminis f. sp. tritici (strain CRL 75-36-700-3 / race SCCL) TaxID=418459 RepID=E3KVX8_PUCGT|nr:uncharacterized protein PGTG_14031 [Puccinia graminis f. sp. tritici CRL 75-36-700-3]EFP88453.2 hypothetical protein PGTG_14031 [Puccinia graminis f. sp. tritici CRL 75-36-700-3]